MDWANRLRAYRSQEGVKQEVLAARLGVSQAFVSRLEAGQAEPGDSLAAQIHSILLDPANRSVLDHIINNVRRNPHIVCLARAEPDQMRYVALSKGLKAHPQFAPVREGQTVQAEFAESGDELLRAILASGAFSGDVETLDMLWVFNLNDGTSHWRGIFTPIQYDGRTWYLHCAMQQMDEADYEALAARRDSPLLINRYN
jgi:transcriptional regulator with XRE-family HTH domain